MTKTMLQVNDTMLERFVDFENFISKYIQRCQDFNKLRSHHTEESIEKNVKLLEKERNIIRLGCGFVLKYVEASKTIFLENIKDDTFSFGVRFEEKYFYDNNSLVDIICLLNDKIKDYFGDKIISEIDNFIFEIELND